MADEETIRTSHSTDDQETVAFRGSSNAPEEAVHTGALLNDRYLLIRQLSRGGFGTVHLAHDKQMHDRLVVVKIQIDPPTDDPWFDRKFSEEVRALSMIDHPGVVVAIDSGRTPDGKPFLVMQFVDGVTLRTVLNPEGMPLDRAAAILKQVGQALGAAHDRGILHRDLKPENLMLQTLPDGSERVRLIDFGIASVADLKNNFQTSTRVAGTVTYMAPEQLDGRVSELSDIYAMGLIAYEMVTGRRPFIAENAVQQANLQRLGVRIRPSDLRPALPLAADRLILESLEYQPSKRPSDARHFGDRLRDALLGSGLPATRQPAKFRIGSRGAVGITIAVVAIAAVLAGAEYWKIRNRPEAPKPTPQADLVAKDAGTDSEVESAFWDSVKDSSDPRFYREYLTKYPHGRFASLAKLKIEILAKNGVPKATGAREEDADAGFWQAIEKSADPQLYQQYLDAYPAGRFAAAAHKKASRLKTSPRTPMIPGLPAGIPNLGNLPGMNPNVSGELSYWTKMKDANNPQSYRDYLAKYPNGMFAPLARMKIGSLDHATAQ